MMNRRSMLRAAAAVMILPAVAACARTSTRQSTGEYIDDATISTRVKARLVESKEVRGREVQVETHNGVVQLSGFVGSATEAKRAVEIARDVPGVRSVKNDIRIKPAN
jgi:hyperosmotically inducible periplasmic protein